MFSFRFSVWILVALLSIIYWMATMLMTNVGDNFVGDNFEMTVTDSSHGPFDMDKVIDITTKVTIIIILQPISKNFHHYKVTNILVSPTSPYPYLTHLMHFFIKPNVDVVHFSLPWGPCRGIVSFVSWVMWQNLILWQIQLKWANYNFAYLSEFRWTTLSNIQFYFW